MKKSEIKVGGVYMAKVSDKVVKVRIDSVHSQGGWNATNTSTGKRIRIKSAQRLRGPAGGTKKELASATKKIMKQVDAKKAKAKAEREKMFGPDDDGKKATTHDAGPGNPKVTVPEDEPTNAAEDEPATEGDKAIDIVGYLAPDDAKTPEPAVADAKPKKPASKKAEKTGDKKPKRVSALDAAAQVLATADKPMGAKDLIAAMADQGLWSSPAGKTPHATLYAAMIREIGTKGDAARFKKVDRGLFEANEGATA